MKKEEIRKDRIKNKIRNIIDSVNFVGENLPEKLEDFIGSRLIRDALYKNMEFAVESIIDICNIINSDLSLGAPENEDTILEHLKNNKIFEENTLDLISEMKKFRNILIHKYGEVDDKVAYENIKEGLKDLEKIIKEIQGFLGKN
jgi:uncharacterized protein YutE (UPF0331/DUF86 family)